MHGLRPRACHPLKPRVLTSVCYFAKTKGSIKGKRQYLLTCKVSRYCLLALHNSAVYSLVQICLLVFFKVFVRYLYLHILHTTLQHQDIQYFSQVSSYCPFVFRSSICSCCPCEIMICHRWAALKHMSWNKYHITRVILKFPKTKCVL